MIKSFLQGLVETEVARQVGELEQRQLAAARVERRPGAWPLATNAGELSAMVDNGRLLVVTPISRKLTRQVVDCSPRGWAEVALGFECETYLTHAVGEAISGSADPPHTMRELLATIAGQLERYGAPSARVQPIRHNPRWPAVLARVGSVDVLGQVCPRPDGSAFVVVHQRHELCPCWHDPEERFP